MEAKQLDLNAPLISVRRLSSTLASPDGVNGKKIDTPRPSRQQSLPLYKSGWALCEVTKPAAVPFVWEQIPGRPKGRSKARPQLPEKATNSPRLPPGRSRHVSGEVFEDRNVFRPQIDDSTLNDYATLLESLNNEINAREDSDLGSEDDAYSDALDTLSPTESFSWNCSVSGLSGYDGSDVKESGTFSTDPQTRDFMMTRFLPAAKAMIVEMPQYVSRKQTVVNEQPRQVKKVVSGELRPLPEQYRSNITSHSSQNEWDAETEDEDGECDDPGRKSSKTCGFFPGLFVKNSLCLLTPVPRMKPKIQTQTPMSSACEVRRLARTTYSGPLPRTHEKKVWDAVYMKRAQYKGQSGELHEAKNKGTGESNQFSHSNDSNMTDGSSPYRHSRGGRISPYRNEKLWSPFHDGATFLGIPKEIENVEANKLSSISKGCNSFQDASSQWKYNQGPGSASPVVEKTLYIDTGNKIKLPILNLVSSEGEGIMKSSREILVENRGMEESSTAKISTQDIRSSNMSAGGSILSPKNFGSLDADPPSSAHILNFRDQADKIESLKLNEDFHEEHKSSEISKVNPNGYSDMNKEHTIIADDRGNAGVASLHSPLPLPLPKSPSESWLWRTLPSISLQIPFAHLHPKKQGQKTSTDVAKWETIVKTSNVHDDHARYSEELISHFSQHNKT